MKQSASNEQSARWERIAEGARRATTLSADDDLEPPFGFAARVIAEWQDARRAERTRMWRQWSLRGAIASLCLTALAVTAEFSGTFPSPNSDIIIPLPPMEIELP